MNDLVRSRLKRQRTHSLSLPFPHGETKPEIQKMVMLLKMMIDQANLEMALEAKPEVEKMVMLLKMMIDQANLEMALETKPEVEKMVILQWMKILRKILFLVENQQDNIYFLYLPNKTHSDKIVSGFFHRFFITIRL